MDHRATLGRARQLHQAGDTTEAIAACRRAAPDDDPVAARLLGLLLAEAGALAEARRWAGRAVALDRSAETLAAEGRVLALMQRWAEAAVALREALAFQPGFTAARRLLDRAEAAAASIQRDAEALFAGGQFAASAAAFRDASTLRPGDAAVLHGLGTALHEAGEPAEAIVAYRAALALTPCRAETWHNLGSAFQATGDLGRAMHAYISAYAIDPACFPRIAQELAAGKTGQVWLSAAALKAHLSRHDTDRDTRPASPAPHLPPG